MNSAESRYRNTALKMNKALIKLLETNKFADISIVDVCREAGVNRTTFYSHYSNTNELLTETTKYLLNSFSEQFFPLAQKKEYFSKEYFEIYLKYIKENRSTYYIFTTNVDSAVSDYIYNFMFRMAKPDFIKHGFTDEKSMRLVFDFTFHGINAVVDKWIKHGCEESVEYMSYAIMSCIVGNSLLKSEKEFLNTLMSEPCC